MKKYPGIELRRIALWISMTIVFEKGRCSKGPKDWIEWAGVRNTSPCGLIFLPPLIGGNLSQGIGTFRSLARKGYDLISFNYSGHGNSSGRFSPGAALRDTVHMLAHAQKVASKRRVPLFGIAPCYSAIPLLYSAHRLNEPLKGIVLINAVLQLNPVAVAKSFLAHYRKMFPDQIGFGKCLTALAHYADAMFPDIRKGRDGFGVLERKRVRLFATLADFLTQDPLQWVTLHKTEVLCLYARHDRILKMYDGDTWTDYRSDVSRICPRTQFRSLEGDHFLSHKTIRDRVAVYIKAFLQ